MPPEETHVAICIEVSDIFFYVQLICAEEGQKLKVRPCHPILSCMTSPLPSPISEMETSFFFLISVYAFTTSDETERE